MTNPHKALGILAASAVLAAGLLGTMRPAAASGLAPAAQIGRQAVVAQHFGDFDRNHNGDYRRDERRREEFRLAELRRQQEIRRIEERRHAEWQRNHRQDFRGGDRYNDHRDWHNDNR